MWFWRDWPLSLLCGGEAQERIGLCVCGSWWVVGCLLGSLKDDVHTMVHLLDIQTGRSIFWYTSFDLFGSSLSMSICWP